MTTLDRRAFLGFGCAAVALALAAPAAAATPSASPFAPPAPRALCPHTLCRHHRPGDAPPGTCGLSLRAPALPEEP